ncbi:MAG: TonB-dependent receptor, partial [Gallionellaceae bacterium]|nr:TonB-dependent receptor [Gallionellaceae bacterium]
MKQIVIFTALLCAVTSFANAETIEKLDEVVVTATRMPQSLGKTIAHSTVLNEKEIRDSGAPDVATLLRAVSGIEIAQSGGLGLLSSTFMRGSNSNQVLVLIDGVRLNSATSGATALEHIMLESIERIEVVRGNVSSLYGSEAIGGVIQLFTKKGQGKPSFTASGGAGTYGTQRMAAGFAGEVDQTSFSLNIGKVKTDGVSAMNTKLAPSANPNSNGYDNNTFNSQIKYAFNIDHAVIASLFATRGDASFDSAYGASTDLNNTRVNLDKRSLVFEDKFSEGWRSTVRFAQGVDESISYANSVLSSRFQTQNNQVAWQNNLSWSETQRLNMGVEYLGQVVASDTLFTKTTRNVNSALAGYVGDYGAQQVQLNFRQDNYSDFGSANTGLLGYGIEFTERWRATASVSNAFKAPTFNDLFYPGYANPNLKPERSQNQELGIHYSDNRHSVDVIYFDNRIRDLITLDSLTYIPYNMNQAQITGEELSYIGDFGNKQVKATATFQNPRNTTTGLLLSRRAREFASIAATHDFGDWSMGAGVRYSGERLDGTHTLPSYHLVNLT